MEACVSYGSMLDNFLSLGSHYNPCANVPHNTHTSRMYYGRKRGFKPVSVYSEEDMDTFRGESDDGTHTPSLVPRPRGRREK